MCLFSPSDLDTEVCTRLSSLDAGWLMDKGDWKEAK